MGIFDRFRKKEPKYDVTNIRVTDLDKNFVFDYDLSNWMVVGVYKYDWGDHYFTQEYKIENDKETCFLNIEDDDELIISISKKVRLVRIGQDLPDYIAKHQTPPSTIEYEGNTYFLENENSGYFNDKDNNPENWVELISWDFVDKSGEFVLCIEQWGEREFEASAGKIIKEYEISNIYPNQ